MEEGAPQQIRRIWKQNAIPVLFTRGKGHRLMVRVPWSLTIRHWLRNGRHNIPEWIPKYSCWETPFAWFDSLVSQLLRGYGQLYVIQPHREQERCARSCWEAKGDHCECQCMGEYHGKDRPGGRWFEVSQTFAISWGPRKLAYRLLRRR